MIFISVSDLKLEEIGEVGECKVFSSSVDPADWMEFRSWNGLGVNTSVDCVEFRRWNGLEVKTSVDCVEFRSWNGLGEKPSALGRIDRLETYIR